MLKLAQLRVHLRNLRTGQWVSNHDPVEWLDIYDQLTRFAIDAFTSRGLGGTFTVTGTPESGRVTVYPASDRTTAIVDYDWHTYEVPES